YMYGRYAITLRIEDDWLYLRGLFLRKTFHKENLASIDLMGRERFYNRKLNRLDVITICDTDGNRTHLPCEYYRNIREIKQALLANFGSHVLALPARQSDTFTLAHQPDMAEEAEMDVFKGHPLFNSL